MSSWLAGASSSSLTVAESDGAPSVSGVSTILVSNTTLTDNTGGSVTIAMTPAGGANTALSNLAAVAVSAALTTGAGTAAALTATAAAAVASSAAGIAAGLTASAATAGTTNAGAAVGGSVTITSGAAARKTSGNANGGDIVITPGAGIGTGTYGILRPSADNILAIGSAALRFTTAFASTGFSIYKAASEGNPTATLGDGVLNFGAGTTNAVDVGLKRDAAGILEATNGSTGYGSLQAANAILASSGEFAFSSTSDPAGTQDLSLIRSSAGLLKVTDGSTGSGSIAATSLTRVAAATDVAPDSTLVKSGDAFPGAATNTTGANTILAGGIGKRIYTVVAYDQGSMAGSTVTVTVNGTATVLTEGSEADWLTAQDNNTTATSLATAIDDIAGVSATASSAVVRIVPDVGTYSLTIAKSAADAGMTATSGVDGRIQVGNNRGTADIVGLRFGDSGYDGYFNIFGAALGAVTDPGPLVQIYQGAIGSYGPAWSWHNSGGDTAQIGGDPGGSGTYIHGIRLSDNSRIAWHYPNDLAIERQAAGVARISNGGDGSVGGNVIASTAITAVGTAAANGYVRTGVYKRAWTNAEVVALGAVDDAELKIATLPAKTIVRNAYVVVDTRETHLTDLTVALGRTGPTYIDYIVASDADVSAESLGSELVTNGTFTTNANGWTLGGAGGAPDWHFDTDHVDRDTGGGTGTLTPSTPLVAVIGTQYKLQWTMAGFSAGTCTASFGGVSGAARGSDATFTEYFTATSTATLAFTPTNDFVGSVDTVILKEVARTVYGDLVTERGTNLTGYDLPSYTTTTDVYLNFVTTDGGHDLTNALQSTGTVYLMTETLP